MRYIKMTPAEKRKYLKEQTIIKYEKFRKKALGIKDPVYENPEDFILNEIDISNVPIEVPKKTYRRRKVKVDKEKVDDNI